MTHISPYYCSLQEREWCDISNWAVLDRTPGRDQWMPLQNLVDTALSSLSNTPLVLLPRSGEQGDSSWRQPHPGWDPACCPSLLLFRLTAPEVSHSPDPHSISPPLSVSIMAGSGPLPERKCANCENIIYSIIYLDSRATLSMNNSSSCPNCLSGMACPTPNLSALKYSLLCSIKLRI